MNNNFVNNYRTVASSSTSRNNLPHADRRQGYTKSSNKNTQSNSSKKSESNSFLNGFINALRMLNPAGGLTKFIPVQTIEKGVEDVASGIIDNITGGVTTEEPKTEETPKVEEVVQTQPEDEGETIAYTYKPGDTFGQVILDLGLGTGNGLWGTDGDVEYYTKQLVDQGALDSYGNIPIGTTIKLKRRK